LEYLSGSFLIDLVPDKTAPRIVLKLRGSTENDEAKPLTTSSETQHGNSAGVNARLQIEKFQIIGDKVLILIRLTKQFVLIFDLCADVAVRARECQN
jgi:hypothetical protein